MRQRSEGSQEGLNPQIFSSWQIFSSGHRGFSHHLEAVMSLENLTVHVPLDHHTLLSHPPEITLPKNTSGNMLNGCIFSIHNQDTHWHDSPHIKEEEMPSSFPSKNLPLSPKKRAETCVAGGKEQGRACSRASPSAELNGSSSIFSHERIPKHTQNAGNGSVFP